MPAELGQSRPRIPGVFVQPREVSRMFYWGLVIGLIIGANIGVVAVGLLSGSKKRESALQLGQEYTSATMRIGRSN